MTTFEFILTKLLLVPAVAASPLATAAVGVTRLAGWGFLKSCFGIWPKLLMKPMVALRWINKMENFVK